MRGHWHTNDTCFHTNISCHVIGALLMQHISGHSPKILDMILHTRERDGVWQSHVVCTGLDWRTPVYLCGCQNTHKWGDQNWETKLREGDKSHSSDLFHSLVQAMLVLLYQKKSCISNLIICFGLTWLVVVDVSKQEEDDTEGGESSPPRKQEHQHYRDHCSKQSCPFTIVVKGWPPT